MMNDFPGLLGVFVVLVYLIIKSNKIKIKGKALFSDDDIDKIYIPMVLIMFLFGIVVCYAAALGF